MSAADAADSIHAERDALLGQTIAGRYLVRKLIGHGGMGAVYEAEHLGIGKRVAIKVVDPEWAKDERVVARFAREARAMSAVESAHIVSVLDAGSEEGRPYLVMELLRGEDLGARLRRERTLALPDAMHVAAQVLKGLARAHAAGIVHRDLKPDNVFLLRSDTDSTFVKIVDFGVSKIERPRNRTSPLALTGRGTVLGTPFYMCPEQAQASPDIDGRADLYSVGAIVFECLCGRPPHTGETYEQVIVSICMRDAPDVRAIDPSIPPEVASFVARALSRDRAQRPASAERMLAALHEVAPEEKSRVPLDPPAPATLMSAGVSRPNVATRVAGSDLPLDYPVTPDTIRDAPRATVPSTHDLAVPPKRRPPSLLITGVVAALAGVGLMLLLVSLLEKRPAPATPTATITSASPPAAPASSPAPIVVVAPPSVSAPPVAAPVKAAPRPKPKGSALDIARDLP
jgi:eukaryotic-like serine/threonine-protein kinase